MGETASYWAGGRANVSNRFASAFWYVPQLGYLASQGYLAHIRQDLAGGDYGLLDLVLDPSTGAVVDFVANPDYFVHALWQRLVAGVALGVSAAGAGNSSGGSSAGLRAWGGCAAREAGGASGGVVFVIVNFDAADAAVTLALEGASLPETRAEYVLTAGQPALGLASPTVALNGRVLAVGAADSALPPLPARVAGAREALVVPAQSVAFVALPGARAPACLQEEGGGQRVKKV